MDSLALLCNLYGDGPATLRRLREAGLGSLEALDGAEPERLAGLLRTSVRSARRFRSEGQLLRERMEPATERAPAERSEPTPRAPADPLLRKVLDTWRRMDDEDLRQSDTPELDPERSRQEQGVQAPASGVAAEPPAGPTGAASAVPPDLQPGALEGLPPEWIQPLAGEGVRTLVDLARCEALEVSRHAHLAYTRLLRLQQVARRALATPPPPTARGPTPGERIGGLLLPRPVGPAAAGRTLPTASAPLTAEEADLRFSPSERPPQPAAAHLEGALPSTSPTPEPARVRPPEALGAEETLDSAGPFA
jgi:hypothetical protein